MKHLRLFSTLTTFFFGLVLINPTFAYGKHQRHNEYAKVVDARPVYQRVAHETPQQSCHYETVTHRDSHTNSYTGTVVGGLLGAAIGHELGHSKRNKNVAAVAGGLLGASIGRDVSRNRTPSNVHYRDERVCHTSYRTEYSQRLIGYDVTYQYHGRLYQTRTDQHPGARIPVDVQLRRVYAR